MIKNVVFDFGQVLVHFEPTHMVKQYLTDAEDVKIVADVLFDRLYWDRLDAGTITDEEVITACKQRLPARLWPALEQIYYNWIYNIPEFEGMAEIIQRVKERYGKRVFLLSNISTYFANHAKEIPILAMFEKCIFSAVCGKVKPNRDIFEHLCETCDISPEETLFIDDAPRNINGAQDFGIHGYLFDGDVDKLRAYLDELFSDN